MINLLGALDCSQVVLFIGVLPFVSLDISGKGVQNYIGILTLYSWLILLFYLITGINVGIKRFHDRNKSGAWMFPGLIPIITFGCLSN